MVIALRQLIQGHLRDNSQQQTQRVAFVPVLVFWLFFFFRVVSVLQLQRTYFVIIIIIMSVFLERFSM